MTEHPSLTPPQKDPIATLDAVQSLRHRSLAEINSDLKTFTLDLQEKANKLSETNKTIEAELQTIDAIAILADIQHTFSEFNSKYTFILDKIAANADAEAAILKKISAELKP